MKITIQLTPKGQRRARHTARGGFSRAYKDPRQVAEENALEFALLASRPLEPISGPVLLGVRAYLPIPASRPKKWKAAAVAGEIRPTTTPDLDNLLKHLKDCLTMMRYWVDDRQVVEYLPGTGKYYSDSPRWEIEIRSAA